MVTVINGGEESVTLKPGTTLALEVSTAPWGDLSDDVFFYSDDESIAEVRHGRKTKQFRQDKTAEEKQFHVLQHCSFLDPEVK